ncbi:MAG: hypothetical protein Q9213_000779 [Squamulea squamosa]
MPFGVATEVADGIKKWYGIDGCLGLGLHDVNSANASRDTFMQRLVDTTTPTLPVFAVDFQPDRKDSKPTVEIGKIDPVKFNRTLNHAPVGNKDGLWAVDNVTFEVPGELFKYKQRMGIGALKCPCSSGKNLLAHRYLDQIQEDLVPFK